MTVCSGFLPPPVGWIVYAIVLLVLAFFLLYRPFKNKSKKSIKIAAVISFMLLLFILFFVFVVIINNTCYYAFKPKFVKDFNLQVSSPEQAKQLLYDYLSGELSRTHIINNETNFEEILNSKVDRISESEESYSVYANQYEYILHKDGKLYQRWLGD